MSQDLLTVYVSIGNSDDKLTQVEWSVFVQEVDDLIHRNAMQIYGAWLSRSDAPWQNACWCFEIMSEIAADLRRALTTVRTRSRQDSVAWAVVSATEFI